MLRNRNLLLALAVVTFCLSGRADEPAQTGRGQQIDGARGQLHAVRALLTDYEFVVQDDTAHSMTMRSGQMAFETSCTKCHEAERALKEEKSREEWLVTIRVMASKEDAEIAAADFDAIATYLAENAGPSNAQRSMSDSAAAGQAKSQTESGLDPALVSSGQAAFNRSCLKCHDADRSLSKSKSYTDWLGTVRRMASKDGADVRTADFEAIATYLTSAAGVGESGMDAENAEGGAGGGWTFGTTVSTIHRSASDEFAVENPGFFADVWMTASYQSAGAWSATVTACTSCHSTNSSISSYSLELVEGSATVDLRQLFTSCKRDTGPQVLLKAGRFVVPFGAFSAMSHPGVYRSVTAPLMFDMGRRVFAPGAAPPRQPVLPLPFSDEGIDLIFRSQLTENLNLGVDVYAVNGLQGTGPNLFNRSRAYSDNNEEPAFGLRTTLGGEFIQFGGSLLHGNLADQGAPLFDYTLWGVDAASNLTDRLRVYFEFARRRQDSPFAGNAAQAARGLVAEAEYKLFAKRNVSMLVRYDTLEHIDPVLGNDSIERLTSGFNVGLPGGSLLMINHELWKPEAANDVDLFGVRWTISLSSALLQLDSRVAKLVKSFDPRRKSQKS